MLNADEQKQLLEEYRQEYFEASGVNK